MAVVFYAFRTMLGIAILMYSVAGIALWLRWHGRLFSEQWFLRMLVAMTPSGIMATLGGWYVAETGRQPWVIFGLLRTADAVSPVPAGVLVSSLIAFVVIYGVFMTAFLVFAVRLIRRGPADAPAHAEASGSLKNAFRPIVLDEPALSGPTKRGRLR